MKNIKKKDCKHYEAVVEQSSPNDFELVDEICWAVKKGGPLHHDEFNCAYCPYYEKDLKERRKRNEKNKRRT